MNQLRLLGAVFTSFISFIPITSQAVLVDNGGGLIYDTVLDITWAQPDTIASTWTDSNTSLTGLTLGGVSGWRLPTLSVNQQGTPACSIDTGDELDCRDNELGYMFYHNLSGILGSSIFASNDPDLALFPDLLAGRFWTDTQFATSPDQIWVVHFFNGTYSNDSGSTPSFPTYAWAVHDGNVGIVPIPAAFWLFGSGLLGMIGITRRKESA